MWKYNAWVVVALQNKQAETELQAVMGFRTETSNKNKAYTILMASKTEWDIFRDWLSPEHVAFRNRPNKGLL